MVSVGSHPGNSTRAGASGALQMDAPVLWIVRVSRKKLDRGDGQGKKNAFAAIRH